MRLWETLGKDGLTKESYETFGDELREIFLDSVREAKEIGLLSTSQRQTIIKLIEKKDRDKRFIKNWRLISILNVDLKINVKALSEKLKVVFTRFNLFSTIKVCQNRNHRNRKCRWFFSSNGH